MLLFVEKVIGPHWVYGGDVFQGKVFEGLMSVGVGVCGQ